MSTTLSDHYDELQRHVDNLFRLGYGPWLIPLRGKIPQLEAWPSLPPATDADVEEWLLCGYNLGLRTGSRSGIFVIDVDKGATWKLPSCLQPTVISPGGGIHCYVRAPNPCPPTTVSDIAPKIDTRGEGGQVTFPGSAHPHGGVYRWANGPLAVADLPPLPRDLLPPPKTVRKRELTPPGDTVYIPTSVPAPDGYIAKALHSEIHAVRTAPEGGRNDQLNRSAFNLGQLVAGGELDCAHVQDELEAAALHAGLGLREIEATIRSGLNSGMQQPRKRPETSRSGAALPHPVEAHVPTRVLVPGSHVIPPDGEYLEVGTNDFSASVFDRLPDEALYVRAGVVGEIHHLDAAFRPASEHRLRSVVDQHVKLGLGKPGKDDEPPKIHYRSCTRDLASILNAYAVSPLAPLRELRYLASHPVYVGRDIEPATPGWNPKSGVYLASSVPEPLELETAKAVLEDLIYDFPFATDADRANYIGLLLTPLLRPAIDEPVPLHLIGSPVERSGKTKLAEIVLGCTVLGRPTPAMQLGQHEDEREKRITSLLLSGASVVHLDNLGAFLGSASLASVLTSNVYQGRLLGSSTMMSVPNGMTVVASGNNVHASGEIAKRILPITLRPVENPESRQDYRHPNLKPYVEDQRERVLGALMGLVEHWRAHGRKLGGVPFGGFERWSDIVGGVMRAAGYKLWATNLEEWRGEADDFGSEVAMLVEEWLARWGEAWVPTSELYELSVELGVLEQTVSTDRGRRTRFGQRVLSAIQGRVLRGHLVEIAGRGERRRARLVGALA